MISILKIIKDLFFNFQRAQIILPMHSTKNKDNSQLLMRLRCVEVVGHEVQLSIIELIVNISLSW